MRKLLTLLSVFSIVVAMTLHARSEEAAKGQSFAGFWTQFKAAVAKNDKEAVASMTKFPVEIGENVSKAAFLKSYPEFFSRKVQACFAKAKPVADKNPQGGTTYSVFCGEEIFLFEQVGGKFLFTGIGMND